MALYEVIKSGSFEQFLAEIRKVDLHEKDELPLREAVWFNRPQMVEYLLKHGARVDVEDNYPIQRAVQLSHIEVAKILVKYGADVAANKNYCLQKAVSNKNIEMVLFLMACGAKLTKDDFVEHVEWKTIDGYEGVYSCGAGFQLATRYGKNVRYITDETELEDHNFIYLLLDEMECVKKVYM